MIIVDLNNLYQRTFGSKPYQIGELQPLPEEEAIQLAESKDETTQISGSTIKTKYLGREVWLPVKFFGLDPLVFFGQTEYFLPWCTVRISCKKNIVKTPLSERQGTVKELYSIDDYTIDIRGFLIDPNRVFPEKQLEELHRFFSINEAVQLDNAITNLFLEENEQRVVLESFDLPEVKGGKNHVKPFAMRFESDSVFDLEL